MNLEQVTQFTNFIEKIQRSNTYDLKQVLNLLTGGSVDVFLFFLEHPHEAFTTREIIRRLGLTEANGYRIIRRLSESGLISAEGYTYPENALKRNGKRTVGGSMAILYRFNEALL